MVHRSGRLVGKKPSKPAKPAKKRPKKTGVDVNSPEGQAVAREVLKQIAPSLPTPQSPWDAAQRSPVHRLPILCNGEASAERLADGTIANGTGHKCKHYWSYRRIPELQNSEGVEKGETLRFCRNWKSADGPMEFGEGREHMANRCDCYEPSDRPYDAEMEQAPPTGKIKSIEVPPPPDFDPGVPTEADYVWTTIYGFPLSQLTFEKDAERQRWIVHRGDAANPLLYVHFRCAFVEGSADPRVGHGGSIEEYARDARYPQGDVRRYDKDRLLALEYCLTHLPLTQEEIGDERHQIGRWDPRLNKWKPVTAAEALAD